MHCLEECRNRKHGLRNSSLLLPESKPCPTALCVFGSDKGAVQIASRLWHQPFGLFIDATCYNGRNEPQDELFKMIELLTPSEITLNLTRIYIYNMNLAFKSVLLFPSLPFPSFPFLSLFACN